MDTEEDIWLILKQVMDPEIPVVSVVDMGIIRGIEFQEDNHTVRVMMTPTFSGCPALEAMQRQVEASLSQAGFKSEVKWTDSPAWSSDWITPQARQNMVSLGLAPPPRHAGFIDLALIEAVSCPYCDSQNTTQKNSFGSTLCRSIYFCNNCHQPFERFKPV
jgi:ring-1,2-phenylacetyl-CoA epoxidase subunit PaaD